MKKLAILSITLFLPSSALALSFATNYAAIYNFQFQAESPDVAISGWSPDNEIFAHVYDSFNPLTWSSDQWGEQYLYGSYYGGVSLETPYARQEWLNNASSGEPDLYNMGFVEAPKAKTEGTEAVAYCDSLEYLATYVWDFAYSDPYLLRVSWDYIASLEGYADASGYFYAAFGISFLDWGLGDAISGTNQSITNTYSGHVERYIYIDREDFTFWGDPRITTQLTVTNAPVPEPSSMLLLGSGLIGLVGFRRKFRG